MSDNGSPNDTDRGDRDTPADRAPTGDGERQAGRSGDSTFASTMDAHERRRAEVEEEYGRKLDELVERVRELDRRVGRTAERYGTIESPDETLESIDDLVEEAEAALRAAAGPGDDRGGDSAAAWPTRGGALRRGINRVVRWLLRDYLETLDRRRDRLVEAVHALSRAAERLVERDVAVRRLAESGADLSRQVEAQICESLQSTVQAVAAALQVEEEFRRVVDAKDAELLQRAVHGQARKAELIFDELARQQESLLAELVGRRQELEALVRRARGQPRED